MFYVAGVATAYIGIYASDGPFLLLLSYIAFGFFGVLLGFNFAHDFCHSTVFKSKKLNNFAFTVIYVLVGAHAEAWKYRHVNSHHYAPNVKDYDTDLQITSLIRVEPSGEYKWFHKFQHFYAPLTYTSYSLYWVFIKDFVVYFTDKENIISKRTTYHISFWIQKKAYLSYILVFPLLFSDHHWMSIVVAFIAMHLLQSLFLLFTFFMTHHVEKTAYFDVDDEGYIKTSWLSNQVKSSNDFYPFSQFANFVFGGFNNHIAHHLFPHIHHVHYPALNKILYKTLNEYDIKPNVTSYWGGIISHLRHLRNLSRRPDGALS
jgi:linoleoyl-CoA desaturase